MAMDPAGFQRAMADLGHEVSRETLDRLKLYQGLVEKWQPAMNLIGSATIPDIWERHFLDSAQLLPLIAPDERRIADFGTGAGFPGLVLAIMGGLNVDLIESDSRKCAFLRQVAIETGAIGRVTIHNARAEKLKPFPVDVATARALAPLDKLVDLLAPFVGESGRCLLHKGERVDPELTRARRLWHMRVTKRRSITDTRGSILIISQLRAKKRNP